VNSHSAGNFAVNMAFDGQSTFKLASAVLYVAGLVSGNTIYAAPAGASAGLAIVLSGWEAAPIWVLAGVLVSGGVGLIFWNNQRKQIARERERMQQAQELANERLLASQALQAKEAADSANRANQGDCHRRTKNSKRYCNKKTFRWLNKKTEE